MKEQLKYIKEHWKHMVLLVLLNFILIATIELLWRKSFNGLISWMGSNFPLMMMNVAFVLMISIIITILTRKYAISYVIVSNLVLVLGLVNAKKISLRSIPLVMDDINLFHEAMNLLPQFTELKTFILLSVFLIITIIFSYVIIKHSHKWVRIDKKHMFYILSLSCIVLFFGETIYGDETDITTSGLLISLIHDARKPTGESTVFDEKDLEAIEFEVYQPVNKEIITTKYKPQLKSEIKPNVIIIQSEAFWDVNKLDLTYNMNPLENFNLLQKESIHGEIYVPVIGGGTSNTEYEILTGMTLKNYYADWHMVYPNEIKAPTTSMASILRANGYYSIATHPYHGWYYNRMEVFNHMGFHEFKSMEFMENPDKMGIYINDAYMTDEIIRNIEASVDPLFNMVVTMQNHAPFNDGRFAPKDLVVQYKEKLTLSTETILNNYVNSLYYSDLELKRLTDYLRSSSEPTVVLLYGDHLPAMGDDYQVYRDTGFLDNDEIFVSDNLEMMSTPFVLWSNYSTTESDLGMINASYVPAMMLEELDLERPDYMIELAKMYKEFPLFTRNIIIDNDGYEEDSESDNYVNMMKKYFALSKIKDNTDNANNLKWLVTENNTYNNMYDLNKVKDPNK